MSIGRTIYHSLSLKTFVLKAISAFGYLLRFSGEIFGIRVLSNIKNLARINLEMTGLYLELLSTLLWKRILLWLLPIVALTMPARVRDAVVAQVLVYLSTSLALSFLLGQELRRAPVETWPTHS